MRFVIWSVALLIGCGAGGDGVEPASFVDPKVLARATDRQHRDCLIDNAVRWARFVECDGERYEQLVMVRGERGDPEAACSGVDPFASPYAQPVQPVNAVSPRYDACIWFWANASCAALDTSPDCGL